MYIEVYNDLVPIGTQSFTILFIFVYKLYKGGHKLIKRRYMSSKKTKRSNYQIGYCPPIEYELVCTSPPDGYESPDYTEEIVEDLDDAEKNIYHKGIPMTVLKEMKIVRYLESDFTNERAIPDFSV